jgi:hypothetical protein
MEARRQELSMQEDRRDDRCLAVEIILNRIGGAGNKRAWKHIPATRNHVKQLIVTLRCAAASNSSKGTSVEAIRES